MADSKEKLFSDFPGVSTEAWMEKITADLKGADFEKKLVWKTNEGFKVKPLPSRRLGRFEDNRRPPGSVPLRKRYQEGRQHLVCPPRNQGGMCKGSER